MVQLLIEEFLDMLGVDVVGPASTLEQANALADQCDAAILDVNLGAGQTSYPLAERLSAENKPFIFLSGYEASSVDRFPDAQKLSKPVRLSLLKGAVESLTKACGA